MLTLPSAAFSAALSDALIASQFFRTAAESFALTGEFAGGSFIVSEVSSNVVLQGLLSVLADKDISAARVRPRDDSEREQIIRLADQLGLAGQLSQAGAALVVNLPEDEDGPEPGQWLAEVAGYVRYGQAAMAVAPVP